MAVNKTPDRLAKAKQAALDAMAELAAAESAASEEAAAEAAAKAAPTTARKPVRLKPKKSAARIRYIIGVEISRASLVAAIQEGYRGIYGAAGMKTDENLNWISEFSPTDGWHQNSIMGNSERAVLIIVSHDDDGKEKK